MRAAVNSQAGRGYTQTAVNSVVVRQLQDLGTDLFQDTRLAVSQPQVGIESRLPHEI